jgi:hypothetical protein
MEQLRSKMQKEAKLRWGYEWPLKRKAKWPVQNFLARKQQKELRKWLRCDKTLSDIELVWICKLEVGEILNDEEGRSVSGLINCQEGRNEFSNCQVDLEKISVEGVAYFQGGSVKNSNFYMGNEMGSLDLIDWAIENSKWAGESR